MILIILGDNSTAEPRKCSRRESVWIIFRSSELLTVKLEIWRQDEQTNHFHSGGV